MILTVTLNPALDLTYTVPTLSPGLAHRVDGVGVRPGGKGLNVAGVLASLGAPVRATGLLGGGTGEQIGALLARSGVDGSFVPIGAESRRTVVVSDGDQATGFWEPGPVVTGAEWHAFRRHYGDLLAGVGVVALAGSVPPGLPADAYAILARAARDRGARVILDADGPALRDGLRAGPDVVKPNRAELAAATGRPVDSTGDALRAAHALRGGGRTAVVATLGADGLVSSTVDGHWTARLGRPVRGNPTGAGDACVAAVAAGLLAGRAWPEVLADAVAWSAAAVLAPSAGTLDPARVTRLRPHVVVHPQPDVAGAVA
jgi:tagatose 6-phosphate kinase